MVLCDSEKLELIDAVLSAWNNGKISTVEALDKIWEINEEE